MAGLKQDRVEFSPREREIIRLVAMGESNQAITAALHVSISSGPPRRPTSWTKSSAPKRHFITAHLHDAVH